MMDLKQYVTDATRTESRIDEISTNPIALQNLLIAFVSIGSMLDQIKKHVFYGKPYDFDKLRSLWEDAARAVHFFRPIEHFCHPLDDKNATPIAVDPRLFHAIIGAMTESTELAEALLTSLTTNSTDVVNVLEEFGDINWYQAIAVDALDGDFEEILTKNIAKLKARFPDKFTSEKAIERDLTKERNILEGNDAS
jgi:NTP pyrophosphatase (non-canonical NTP hydrolase)